MDYSLHSCISLRSNERREELQDSVDVHRRFIVIYCARDESGLQGDLVQVFGERFVGPKEHDIRQRTHHNNTLHCQQLAKTMWGCLFTLQLDQTCHWGMELHWPSLVMSTNCFKSSFLSDTENVKTTIASKKTAGVARLEQNSRNMSAVYGKELSPETVRHMILSRNVNTCKVNITHQWLLAFGLTRKNSELRTRQF